MKEYNTHRVVSKLVGTIIPAGASHIDEVRFENLKEMCSLVEMLLSDIDDVARLRHRVEHSIKKSGNYAHNFLRQECGIKEEI